MSVLAKSIEDLKENPGQWEAFNTTGNCVVVAPPGSGKTKLLTTRMAYDLATHVPQPHGTACVTLTVAAANELRTRLASLGSENRNASFVGTVHGFALTRILVPFAEAVGRPELSRLHIATSAQQNAAYSRAIRENFTGDTTNLQSTIEVFRKRLPSQEQWSSLGTGVWETFKGYKSLLREGGLLDFDGVIEEAVDMVEASAGLRKVLQTRYRRFYVDEYQDLAPGLDRLVELLCFGGGSPSTLFAVGDPDQAIFSFTGTRPELLYQMAGRPDVTAVRLDRNYRCGEAIIRSASFMKESTQKVTGVRQGGEISTVYCPGGFAEQLERVALSIAESSSAGLPLHNVAVICATNDQCSQVGAALEAKGIPAVYRTNKYRLTTATALIENSAAWCFAGQENSGIRLSSLLTIWRGLCQRDASEGKDSHLARALLSFDATKAPSATDFVQALLDAGLESALDYPSNSEERIEVSRMFKACEDGFARNDALLLAQRALKTGRVEIMTMTSSKGLEFSRVLIPGMDQGSVPSYYSSKDPAQMPEERRKFYVTLTRAKDSVQFFYSGYTVGRYGPMRNGPSVFLKELGLLT